MIDMYEQYSPNNGNNNSFGGLDNGEFVYCMIFAEVPSMTAEKDFLADEEKRKAEYEAIGEEYIPNEYDPTALGIGYDVAVVHRNVVIGDDHDAMEETVDLDADPIVVPNYFIGCHIQQFPPAVLCELRSNKGNKIGDMFSLGYKYYDKKKNEPVCQKLFPNVNVLRHYENGISFENQVKADKIPPGKEEQYQELIEKETERKEKWDSLITAYDSMSHAQKLDYLRSVVARRFGLLNIVDDVVTLIQPEPGVVFRAVVEKFNDSAYFNIKVVDNWKNNKYPFYSNLIVEPPTEEAIEYARRLKIAIDEAKKISKQTSKKSKKA